MLKFLLYVVMFVGVIAIMSVLLALPTMYLWNWLMVELFKLPKLDFWQAMGLCFLARLLLGTGSVSSSSK